MFGWAVTKLIERTIEQFREVHGDKYHYSYPQDAESAHHIKIACPKHGQLKISAFAHLKREGCFACYGHNKPFIHHVIQEFKKVWGGVFDYSETVYLPHTSRVKIICPEHGAFWMKPVTHLRGKGCCYCSLKDKGLVKKYKSEAVVRKKKLSIHQMGNMDTSNESKLMQSILNQKGVQVLSKDISKILNHHRQYAAPIKPIEKKEVKFGILSCSKHGITRIKKSANEKCPYCTGKALNTENLRVEFTLIYGGRYCYSKMLYVNGKTPVTVTCFEHGDFNILHSKHRKGVGCPLCK